MRLPKCAAHLLEEAAGIALSDVPRSVEIEGLVSNINRVQSDDIPDEAKALQLRQSRTLLGTRQEQLEAQRAQSPPVVNAEHVRQAADRLRTEWGN